MKKVFYLLAIALSLGFYSCANDNYHQDIKKAVEDNKENVTPEPEIKTKLTALTFNINFSEDIEFTEENPFTIKIKNLATEKEETIVVEKKEAISISLEEGKYSLSMSNKVYYYEEAEFDVKGESLIKNINLQNKLVSKTWVISEVQYNCHQAGRSSLSDHLNYIELYNNSNETLYLDGLCFSKTQMRTQSTRNVWTKFPNYSKEKLYPAFILQFPGSGKEHPVKAGDKVLIQAIGNDGDGLYAIDRNFLKKRYDFTKVTRYQFLKDSDDIYIRACVTNIGCSKVLSDDIVPALEIIFNSEMIDGHGSDGSFSFSYEFNKESVFIFKPKEGSIEDYINGKIMKTKIGNYVLKTYPIDMDLVIDAVEIGQSIGEEGNLTPTIGQKLIPNALDKGFGYCYTMTDKDLEYLERQRRKKQKPASIKYFDLAFSRVIRRKVKEEVNGRKVLQDTNNSTEDFDHNVISSYVVDIK